MKDFEKIEKATETIKLLEDFIKIKKIASKIKIQENTNALDNIITYTVSEIQLNVKEL